jgi:hypothetical protein
MARRKNTRFIDPRYFMDEKMEVIKEQDLVEDASREKMDALMDAGIDPGDINDCRQSEYGMVKCLVMKNTGYANQLRDLGYIPAQPGSRDLKEQEGQDAVKALLEKIWNSLDGGKPQISAELGDYGGEGCRDIWGIQKVIDRYEKIMGEVNDAANSIKEAQTMVHQLQTAVKAGRSDVKQILRYYSKLVDDATAAYEAAKAMNPEDQNSIKMGIFRACQYGGPARGNEIKGMIERALGH